MCADKRRGILNRVPSLTNYDTIDVKAGVGRSFPRLLVVHIQQYWSKKIRWRTMLPTRLFDHSAGHDGIRKRISYNDFAAVSPKMVYISLTGLDVQVRKRLSIRDSVFTLS